MLLPIIPMQCEHVGQVPVDESDDDGDGFVECELTNGVSWSNANTTPTVTQIVMMTRYQVSLCIRVL